MSKGHGSTVVGSVLILLLQAGRISSFDPEGSSRCQDQAAPTRPERTLSHKTSREGATELEHAHRRAHPQCWSGESDSCTMPNATLQMDNPYTITYEGHEIQFVTNYLGPWLFTQLVLPRVLESESKRVVLVASSGHVNGKIRWDDPAFKTGYNKKEA